ncbi:MAG TPA: hypothetical protein VLH15_08695 [Dehalococcoidales bacterium]|nr:hypothetical protein [Dehalococcoidales bacterium]
MENKKTCSRCRGRMFLEYDYVDRVYEYSCISCGCIEPVNPASFSKPTGSAAAGAGPGTKDRELTRA